MTQRKKSLIRERRKYPRLPLDGMVHIVIGTCRLKAHAENVSADGMLLTAEGEIPVELFMGMERTPVKGTLVRVQPVNAKTLGFAIRFDDSATADLLGA